MSGRNPCHTMSGCSGRTIRWRSFVASGESNRQSSTLVACAEKSAKFTPTPVQVAPRGYGSPGHTRREKGGVYVFVHAKAIIGALFIILRLLPGPAVEQQAASGTV